MGDGSYYFSEASALLAFDGRATVNVDPNNLTNGRPTINWQRQSLKTIVPEGWTAVAADPPAGAGLNTPAPGEPASKPSLNAYGVGREDGKVRINPSPEEKALLGDATLRSAAQNGKDDVEVYYVNRISDGSGGESFVRVALRAIDQALADSVVMSKVQTVFDLSESNHYYRTLAHETVHILEERPNTGAAGDRTHFPYSGVRARGAQRVNLMVTGTVAIIDSKGWLFNADGSEVLENGQPQVADFGPGIFDSRRLTTGQESDVTTKRPDLIYPVG